jgi:16S rRNA (cytosine1402-N4)-methyltransferase
VVLLHPKTGESYLDLTAGYGGHAQAILARTGAYDEAILVDRDQTALNSLSQLSNQGARLWHTDFYQAVRELQESSQTFDLILLDLGVSSMHLDRAERGFSFNSTGPLDMRMDINQQLTAHEVVNSWSESDLTQAIHQYGEESRAKQIAKQIILNRPIESTTQLASIIEQIIPRTSRIHPATKTFQALRIVVNDELGQLAKTLPLLPDVMTPGGRLAIISFHSLEDRLVKQFFVEDSRSGYEQRLELLTKKPVRGETDDVHNPRARSAKLRAVVKIKRKGRINAN